MREHPILFSAPMVRALLAGRKSVTRRLSKQWLKVKAGDHLWVRETWAAPDKVNMGRVAYNADGLCGAWLHDGEGGKYFIAHGRILEAEGYRKCFPGRGADTYGLAAYGGVPRGPYPHKYGWRPSIFCPRWASRITLEALEDARVEKLWDITDEEARREGVQVLPLQSADDPSAWWQVEQGEHQARTPRESFRSLWQSLHTEPGERWEDNPELVRVGSFRRTA